MEIGILCIHGIGNAGSREGDFPRQVGHCLELSNNLNPKLGLQDYNWTRAESVDRDSVVTLIDLESDVTINLYDGIWHNGRPPLSQREVLKWIFSVAHILPVVLAAGWLNDRSTTHLLTGGEKEDGYPFGAISMYMIGSAFAPIVLLILFIWWILSLIIPKFREPLYSLIVDRFGDALLYGSSRLDASMEKMRTDLDRIRQKNNFVGVLGHSQGAEIARRLAFDGDVDFSIHVGSGTFILSALRAVHKSIVARLLFYPVLFIAFYMVWIMVENMLSFGYAVYSCGDNLFYANLDSRSEDISAFQRDAIECLDGTKLFGWTYNLQIIGTFIVLAGIMLAIHLLMNKGAVGDGFLPGEVPNFLTVSRIDDPVSFGVSALYAEALAAEHGSVVAERERFSQDDSGMDPSRGADGEGGPLRMIAFIPRLAEGSLWWRLTRPHLTYFSSPHTGFIISRFLIGDSSGGDYTHFNPPVQFSTFVRFLTIVGFVFGVALFATLGLLLTKAFSYWG